MRFSLISSVFVLATMCAALPIERENTLVARLAVSDVRSGIGRRAHDDDPNTNDHRGGIPTNNYKSQSRHPRSFYEPPHYVLTRRRVDGIKESKIDGIPRNGDPTFGAIPEDNRPRPETLRRPIIPSRTPSPLAPHEERIDPFHLPPPTPEDPTTHRSTPPSLPAPRARRPTVPPLNIRPRPRLPNTPGT